MPKEPKFSYPPGLRLNKDEVHFIRGALIAIAEQAKADDKPPMFNMAMELAQRLEHAEMAGEGVSPELQKRLQTGLDRAAKSGNAELAERAFSNFLTTMVRLHPDPARALGGYVINYLNKAVRASIEPAQIAAASEGAVQIIERFTIKLEGLTETYDQDEMGEWPEARDIVEYLVKWTAAGKSQLERGGEPWEGDEHIAKALAADSEAAEEDGVGD